MSTQTSFDPHKPYELQQSQTGEPNQQLSNPYAQHVLERDLASKPASSSPAKRLLIIVGLIAVAVVLVSVVAISLSSGTDNPKQKTDQLTASGAPSNAALEPATAISVEQVSNALVQDMSALDDERDFSTKPLENTTLGL